jgi:hypothetical protein
MIELKRVTVSGLIEKDNECISIKLSDNITEKENE